MSLRPSSSIAFFDFDGTLLIRESRTLCALPSVQRGLISPLLGLRILGSFIASRLGAFPKERADAIAFECYRSSTPEEIARTLDGLHADVMRAWLSAPVVARVAQHHAAGDQVVIATASASFFAEPAARELGIADVIGTDLEMKSGVCTGHVLGHVLRGEHKLARVRQFAQERGVSLADCSFYSDHINDLPLLDAVGTPVAVGPNRPLRIEAKRRGWEIIEHRRADAASTSLSNSATPT
jgi:HAD superfamily hydrolase (TIGR01490 family)